MSGVSPDEVQAMLVEVQRWFDLCVKDNRCYAGLFKALYPVAMLRVRTTDEELIKNIVKIEMACWGLAIGEDLTNMPAALPEIFTPEVPRTK